MAERATRIKAASSACKPGYRRAAWRERADPCALPFVRVLTSEKRPSSSRLSASAADACTPSSVISSAYACVPTQPSAEGYTTREFHQGPLYYWLLLTNYVLIPYMCIGGGAVLLSYWPWLGAPGIGWAMCARLCCGGI